VQGSVPDEVRHALFDAGELGSVLQRDLSKLTCLFIGYRLCQ
jgi:hypothetical protein